MGQRKKKPAASAASQAERTRVPQIVITRDGVDFLEFESAEELLGFAQLFANQGKIHAALAEALAELGHPVAGLAPPQPAAVKTVSKS